MSFVRPQRGRPKGSGIDDRAKLRDIASLLASQPHIKPTTAIKMLGETDPSVIRRLRDKFYSVQQDLMAEVRAGPLSQPNGTAASHRGSSYAGPLRTLPLEVEARERRVELPPPQVLAHQLASPPSEPDDMAQTTISKERLSELAAYNVMLGFAIQATVSAIQSQVAMCEQAVRMPPIAAMLRQQIELGEMIMSMAWPGGRPPAPRIAV